MKLGLGAFSNFGSMLDYSDTWVGRYYLQEATLLGFSLMPAIAYRVNDHFSVGAGLNAMYGIFEEKVAINNVLDALPDGQLEIKDNEWGFGANLGMMYEFDERTRFGLTYSSKVDLDFEDSPEFKGLGPGLSFLLTASQFRKLDLGMTVPQTVMTSSYHDLNDRFALMGNVGWQDWSDFGKVDVRVEAATTTDITVDLDYKDTWHAAIGGQYRPSSSQTYSAGIAYDREMMDDDQLTVALPVSDSWRFGLAYELIYSGNLPIDQNRGPLAGRVSGDFDDVTASVLTFSFVWKPE